MNLYTIRCCMTGTLVTSLRKDLTVHNFELRPQLLLSALIASYEITGVYINLIMFMRGFKSDSP